jgi:2-amino-4-hydroxy-6-hydroxymethyldihydropteridine diphosphokinase
MTTVYLSLGSNIGDRAGNIARAIEALTAHGVHIVKQSSLYETEPVNVRGGGWFLNAAIEAEVDMMPRQLMEKLLAIEQSLGRVRRSGTESGETAKQYIKEPRTIDIDILLLGETVIDIPGLTIPHPRMAERRFVLTPLAEIAPEARHPVSRQTVAELLARTPDSSQVRLFREDPPG